MRAAYLATSSGEAPAEVPPMAPSCCARCRVTLAERADACSCWRGGAAAGCAHLSCSTAESTVPRLLRRRAACVLINTSCEEVNGARATDLTGREGLCQIEFLC